MMSASNDPLFLQFKEANQSVLEPYAGKSAYAHPGQRVVMGQRQMQPASDVFLGWTTTRMGTAWLRAAAARREDQAAGRGDGRRVADAYAEACGWVLARAHAKAAAAS